MAARALHLFFVAVFAAQFTIWDGAEAQQSSGVLPQVKEKHLKIISPATNIPAACGNFVGAFSGQFDNGGPLANIVITDVQTDGRSCIFHGIYAWSAYRYDTRPGSMPVGPGTLWETHMDGADLVFGSIQTVEMIVHPNLQADYYYRGSLTSRAQFERIAKATLE